MFKTIKRLIQQQKETFRIPRKVQDLIPINRIWKDGIFRSGNMFNKTYRFSHINYQLAALDDKKQMLLYQKRDEAGDYGDIEKQYSTTKLGLLPNLSKLKQEIFKQYEEHQNEVRSFSTRYGFLAGLYCGFMQCFTSDQSIDGGFDKFVSSQIFMMPNMCNYSNNYNHITQKNILYSKLSENENVQISNYLVVVDCTWSQRCYSASIDGLYCGYRAALAIFDMVGHLKHKPKTKIDKLQMMERYWRFPRSMIKTELQ